MIMLFFCLFLNFYYNALDIIKVFFSLNYLDLNLI